VTDLRPEQFSTTWLRWGYDSEEVDAFLEAIRETFLGIREPFLTSDDVRNKQFSATRWRRGYDEEVVDALLEEVALRLAFSPPGQPQDNELDPDAYGLPIEDRPTGGRTYLQHREECQKAWDRVDQQPGTYLPRAFPEGGMNMNPELDEHGIPQEARPPRKWLGYLLTGICLASGIGQMYWSVSIASTQMVGVYHRWKHDNYVPLSPFFVAIFVSLGVGLWLDKEKDKYTKTERRVLYTALILAMALGIIGWLIISLIEPYHDASWAAGR
jgi:DivIVA domain-containing protein